MNMDKDFLKLCFENVNYIFLGFTFFYILFDCYRFINLLISIKKFPKIVKAIYKKAQSVNKTIEENRNGTVKPLTFLKNLKKISHFINKDTLVPILLFLLLNSSSIVLGEPSEDPLKSDKSHFFIINDKGELQQVLSNEERIKHDKEQLLKQTEQELDEVNEKFMAMLIMSCCFIVFCFIWFNWHTEIENLFIKDHENMFKGYDMTDSEQYLKFLIKHPEYRNEPYFSEYALKWLGKEDRLRRHISPLFVGTSVGDHYKHFVPEYVDQINAELLKYDREHTYKHVENWRLLYSDVTRDNYFKLFHRTPYQKTWDEMDIAEQFFHDDRKLDDILRRQGKDPIAIRQAIDDRYKRDFKPKVRLVTQPNGDVHSYMFNEEEGHMMKSTPREPWFLVDENDNRIHVHHDPIVYPETGKSYITHDAFDNLIMNDLKTGELMRYTEKDGWHFFNKDGKRIIYGANGEEIICEDKKKKPPKNTSFVILDSLYKYFTKNKKAKYYWKPGMAPDWAPHPFFGPKPYWKQSWYGPEPWYYQAPPGPISNRLGRRTNL